MTGWDLGISERSYGMIILIDNKLYQRSMDWFLMIGPSNVVTAVTCVMWYFRILTYPRNHLASCRRLILMWE